MNGEKAELFVLPKRSLVGECANCGAEIDKTQSHVRWHEWDFCDRECCADFEPDEEDDETPKLR